MAQFTLKSLLAAACLAVSGFAIAAPARVPDLYATPVGLTLSDGRQIEAEEGWLFVPENRLKAGSRQIPLYFIRVPGREPRSGPPIFFLPGGPGSTITRSTLKDPSRRDFTVALASGRDVIFLNQRGSPATIAGLPPYSVVTHGDLGFDEDPRGAVQRAVTEAKQVAARRGIDLTGYDILHAADDIDALRQALKYERIILFGNSFGSQWSLAYLRRYSEYVDRALLSGIEPLDFAYDSPADLWSAISRLSTLAAADPELRTSRLGERLDVSVSKMLTRLDQAPVEIAIMTGRDGEPKQVRVTGDKIRRVLLRPLPMQSDRENLAVWPKFASELVAGDYRYAAVLIALEEELPLSRPMIFWLIDNSLGISAARDARLIAEARRSPLGDVNYLYRLTREVSPTRQVPEAFRIDKPIDTPVLLINGDIDLSTPVENSEALARQLRNGQLVIVAGGGTHEAVAEMAEFVPDAARGLVEFLAAEKVGSGSTLTTLPAQVQLPPLAFARIGGIALYDAWLANGRIEK